MLETSIYFAFYFYAIFIFIIAELNVTLTELTYLENCTDLNTDTLDNWSLIKFYDPDESLINYLHQDYKGLMILQSYYNNKSNILSEDIRSLLVEKMIDCETDIYLRNVNYKPEQQLNKFQ